MSALTELAAWAAGKDSAVRTLHLRGHGLFHEGKPFRSQASAPRGEARCACGTISPILDSDAARKRWHRGHLVRVLDGGVG